MTLEDRLQGMVGNIIEEVWVENGTIYQLLSDGRTIFIEGQKGLYIGEAYEEETVRH